MQCERILPLPTWPYAERCNKFPADIIVRVGGTAPPTLFGGEPSGAVIFELESWCDDCAHGLPDEMGGQ